MTKDVGAAEISMRLEQAVSFALTSNRALIAARLTRDEQRVALRLAEDRYRLKGAISASTDFSRDHEQRKEVALGPALRVPTGGQLIMGYVRTLSGDHDLDSAIRIGFSQPLLRGFGITVDTAPLRKARLRERINLGVHRDQIAAVVDAVIVAYRSLIRAEHGAKIRGDSLDRARNQLRINRALVESGRMAAREVVRTEAEIANRELGVIESGNRLELAHARLADLLDMPGEARIRPMDGLEQGAPVHPDLSESIQTAMALRTDHLAARFGVEVATLDLAVARNNRLWDLDLNADFTRPPGEAEWDYRAFVTLRIPLRDRSRRLGVFRAKNTLRRAELALAESRDEIGRQVRQAVRQVEVGLQRIELAGRARELSTQNLSVERRKLELGLTSTLQLALVEDDMVNAQITEADAVLSYLDALTSLDRAVGTTLERWGVRIERADPPP